MYATDEYANYILYKLQLIEVQDYQLVFRQFVGLYSNNIRTEIPYFQPIFILYLY